MGHAKNKKKPGRYRVRGRIWLESAGGTLLGNGRAVLLENIRDLGSISAAARSLDMSYAYAWKLVDAMNRESTTPVVERSTGGRGGGGARLTPAGVRAVEAFRAAQNAFDRFLDEQTEELRL